MTNVNVRKTLENTCVDLGNQGRDNFFGFGRIDAKAATGMPCYKTVVRAHQTTNV